MRSLIAFITFLILLAGSSAQAVTLALNPPAPHGNGPGSASIIVNVEVSDGFTTSLAVERGQVLLASDGNATANVDSFGIIDPSVQFNSFAIDYGSVSAIERTFGSAAIPISVAFDTALIGGPASPRALGQSLLGEFGSLNITLADMNVLVSGTVSLLGSSLPFSITEADLISGLTNPAFLPNAADDVNLLNIAVRSAFVDIGSAGGVSVRLSVWNLGADNIQFVAPVPEPSTALLMGLGLVGLGVRGRR